MPTSIEKLLHEQQEIIKKIENEIQLSDNESLQIELQELKQKLSVIETRNTQLERAVHDLDQKNERYRLNIAELLRNERNRLIQHDTTRIKALLEEQDLKAKEALQSIEHKLLSEYNEALSLLQKNERYFEQETLQSLMEYKRSIKQYVDDFRMQEELLADQAHRQLHQHEADLYSRAIPHAAIEKNYFDKLRESNIGVRLFNYLGIFFIFLAAISLGMFSMQYMTPILKMIFLYILGASFTITGHFLYRKHNQVFAAGFIGGGIGLFYIATVISYFFLGMTQEIALLLLILIMMLVITLAIRYKQLTLAIIGAIGGYIPLFSYLWILGGFSASSAMFVRIYIVLLTISLIYIARKFKWQPLFALSNLLFVPWIFILRAFSPDIPATHLIFAAIYMLIYVLDIYIFDYKKKKEISLFNTYVYCFSVLTYALISSTFITPLHSLINVYIFGSQILIFLTSYLLFKRTDFSKNVSYKLFFWLIVIWTELVIILYIPIIVLKNSSYMLLPAFGLFCIFMFLRDKFKSSVLQKQFSWLAAVEFCLYICIFFLLSITNNFSIFTNTLVFASIVLAYLLNKKSPLFTSSVFNLISHFTLWAATEVYVFYITNKFLALPNVHGLVPLTPRIGVYMLIQLFISYGFSKIKAIEKTHLPTITYIVYLIVLPIFDLYALQTLPRDVFVVNSIISLLLHITVICTGTKAVFMILQKKGTAKENTGIFIAFYLLLTMTILVNVNISYKYIQIIMDIVYAVASFCFIFIGFKRNYSRVRSIGLYFMLATMLKLLVIDIAWSTLLWRIIAFSLFGVISLIISFSYSRSLNKLTKEMEEFTE